MGSKRGSNGENSMVDLINSDADRLRKLNFSQRRSMLTKSPVEQDNMLIFGEPEITS